MKRRGNYADEGGVLMACSICGCARSFPQEMVYRVDRTFMCDWHRDTTTNLEEAQKHGTGARKGGEGTPSGPMGPKPSYFP